MPELTNEGTDIALKLGYRIADFRRWNTVAASLGSNRHVVSDDLPNEAIKAGQRDLVRDPVELIDHPAGILKRLDNTVASEIDGPKPRKPEGIWAPRRQARFFARFAHYDRFEEAG
jgi:hypothetical protein